MFLIESYVPDTHRPPNLFRIPERRDLMDITLKSGSASCGVHGKTCALPRSYETVGTQRHRKDNTSVARAVATDFVGP